MDQPGLLKIELTEYFMTFPMTPDQSNFAYSSLYTSYHFSVIILVIPMGVLAQVHGSGSVLVLSSILIAIG